MRKCYLARTLYLGSKEEFTILSCRETNHHRKERRRRSRLPTLFVKLYSVAKNGKVEDTKRFCG